MEFLEVALRTLCSFIVLLIVTRLLGKKQISQLTFFNYVTGITIGSVAADFTVNEELTITEGATSLLGWSLLTLLAGFISLKSAKGRVIIDGQPTILIRDGLILVKAMRRCRINIDDLSMLLRSEDCFSVKDVEYAILEPNGQLSVMKKSQRETVTRGDMNLPPEERRRLPAELIMDGRIVFKNLKELNVNQAWLEQELLRSDVTYEQVFYAELQSDGSLHIQKYRET